jgi:hypothetical protein
MEQRPRPHVRIVPAAWLNQAVFKARNAEKCTIRTSYSASASTGEADEPCSARARGEGLLGFADAGTGGVGAPEDEVRSPFAFPGTWGRMIKRNSMSSGMTTCFREPGDQTRSVTASGNDVPFV